MSHLAPGNGAQKAPHRRPLVARHITADTVVIEHADHMPAVLFGDTAQFENLVFGGLLIGGRAAGIDGDAFGNGRL
jgi:hypothetical protein